VGCGLIAEPLSRSPGEPLANALSLTNALRFPDGETLTWLRDLPRADGSWWQYHELLQLR
jgi:hypothetical protein